MSNSSLASYTHLSPNCTAPRTHAIDTVTVHCTAGNKNNTAKQIADLSNFTTADSQHGASCNYAVGGDGSIALVVDEANRSWCSSNRVNDHRAVTIEVASNTTGTEVNDQAYAALLDLLTDICKRNGIKALVWSTNKTDRVNHLNGCNMTVHRDYAQKACPGEWLYSRHGEIAAEVNRRLGETEEEEVTQDQFDKMMDNWLTRKANAEPAEWSAEDREWAESNGLICGDGSGKKMYRSYTTREQMVVFLHRLAEFLTGNK